MQYQALKIARDALENEINDLKRKKSALGMFDIVEKLKLSAAIALSESKLADLNSKLGGSSVVSEQSQTAPNTTVFKNTAPISHVTTENDLWSYNDPRSVDELVAVFADYFKSPEFSEYDIRTNIPATEFGADPKCIPLQFLFSKNGNPVLAVAIVTKRGYTHGAVTGTQYAIIDNRIKYIRFFAGMPNEKDYVVSRVLDNL